ncbi:unnamed protein product [Gongylonema pulchrum]|uniref:ANK_REP_REGION domain-containing protein n=1 Tax=Gongylonema pulchrum TaxID=637853 RepID=A0A183D310_9BILA|nr:unnamed protein product [Gongylonema pulchrum]
MYDHIGPLLRYAPDLVVAFWINGTTNAELYKIRFLFLPEMEVEECGAPVAHTSVEAVARNKSTLSMSAKRLRQRFHFPQSQRLNSEGSESSSQAITPPEPARSFTFTEQRNKGKAADNFSEQLLEAMHNGDVFAMESIIGKRMSDKQFNRSATGAGFANKRVIPLINHTPLELAVRNQCPEMIFLLKSCGADVNIVDRQGNSILMLALRENPLNWNCILALLSSGAQ